MSFDCTKLTYTSTLDEESDTDDEGGASSTAPTIAAEDKGKVEDVEAARKVAKHRRARKPVEKKERKASANSGERRTNGRAVATDVSNSKDASVLAGASRRSHARSSPTHRTMTRSRVLKDVTK